MGYSLPSPQLVESVCRISGCHQSTEVVGLPPPGGLQLNSQAARAAIVALGRCFWHCHRLRRVAISKGPRFQRRESWAGKQQRFWDPFFWGGESNYT